MQQSEQYRVYSRFEFQISYSNKGEICFLDNLQSINLENKVKKSGFIAKGYGSKLF